MTFSSMPSTPVVEILIPISAARFKPADSGSIPTIQTGSIQSERIIFISKSVPILPGPIITAFNFLDIVNIPIVRQNGRKRCQFHQC